MFGDKMKCVLLLALNLASRASALRVQPPTRRSLIRSAVAATSLGWTAGSADAFDSMPANVPSAVATGRPGGQLNYNEVFEKGKYGAPPKAFVAADPDALRAERMKKKAAREKKAKAKNVSSGPAPQAQPIARSPAAERLQRPSFHPLPQGEADALLAKLDAAADAADAAKFADAMDTLSLWIIEQVCTLTPRLRRWPSPDALDTTLALEHPQAIRPANSSPPADTDPVSGPRPWP